MEERIKEYLEEKYNEALERYDLNKEDTHCEYFVGYLDMIAEIRAYINKIDEEERILIDFI